KAWGIPAVTAGSSPCLGSYEGRPRAGRRAHARGGVKPKPFPCSVQGCERRFSRSDELNRHLHASCRGHSCRLCEKAYLSKAMLKEHEKTHGHQRRTLGADLLLRSLTPCHTYRQEFPFLSTRSVPGWVKSACSSASPAGGPRPLLPPVAQCTRPLWPLRQVVSPSEGGPMSPLRAEPAGLHGQKGHLKIHQNTYDCSYCGKAFFTTAGLKNHVSLHTGERQFKCDTCSKAFPHKSALSIHRWVHVEDRPHKCDTCPKSFGLKGQLVAHKKCHVNRDRYLCNICGRSVFDLRSLTRHKLTHSTERRFGCKVCGKHFKLEGTLKAHEKVHTVRDRMYLCHVCCKTFLSNNTLMAHMKTHSDERPFVCSVCTRSFITKWDLKKHIRVHTGEAPYGCTKCGRHFKLKSTLNVHIRSHLGIKRPYQCSLCDKAFTQSHCLKTHMKSYHPEEILLPQPSTSGLQPPDPEFACCIDSKMSSGIILHQKTYFRPESADFSLKVGNLFNVALI
uniref:Zinc finger protein 37-like n=1 Tax=Fundulus heteroclitus TaxID=8078 RepID=A0A3Q2T964_FUNHE